MKPKTLSIIMLLTVALLVPVAFAAAPIDKVGPHLKSGKKDYKTMHLYLYEKNSSDWSFVEDGAWGKMKYNTKGTTFDFVFNGHGLEPETNYTLIYYADPWPGDNGVDIVSGASNVNGNLHLKGSADIGDIPVAVDENSADGAKIWLVLSEDYDTDETKMIGWNPGEYLFEHHLITFDDTDVP